MPPAFWEWFSDRQRELNLNDSAVARLAGIAASVISKARSEEQAIGPEALEKIADALKTPRSTVYRLTNRIEEQIARAGRGGALPDPDVIIATAKMFSNPDTWHLPFPELRGIIVRALPALYVLRGQLTPGPKET